MADADNALSNQAFIRLSATYFSPDCELDIVYHLCYTLVKHRELEICIILANSEWPRGVAV